MGWHAVPLTVLQAVSRQLSVADATSARLACSNWAQGIPLPRICIDLDCDIFDSSKQTRQQQLLHSLQRPASCSRMARQCWITVPADNTYTLRQSFPNQQQLGSKAVCDDAHWDPLMEVAAALSHMPYLDSLCIKTSSTAAASRQSSSAAAIVDLLAALVTTGTSDKLQSLSLSLSSWPTPQELNSVLTQLTSLHTLQLHRCPVAVVCSLPTLPELQNLGISGILTEPIPRSYSYRRQGPLLPLLPGLRRLVLRNMPLDLRHQELDDIQQQQRMEGIFQQQLLQECQAASSDTQPQAASSLLQLQTVVPYGQWVGTSITKQCHNLRHLVTDMQLGPAVAHLSGRRCSASRQQQQQRLRMIPA